MEVNQRTVSDQVNRGRTILLTVISVCTFLLFSISIVTAQTDSLVSPPLGSF